MSSYYLAVFEALGARAGTFSGCSALREGADSRVYPIPGSSFGCSPRLTKPSSGVGELGTDMNWQDKHDTRLLDKVKDVTHPKRD